MIVCCGCWLCKRGRLSRWEEAGVSRGVAASGDSRRGGGVAVKERGEKREGGEREAVCGLWSDAERERERRKRVAVAGKVTGQRW